MINKSEKYLLDQTYTHKNFQFRYPGYWEIDEQQTEDDLTVSIMTEGSCFWMLTYLDEEEDPVEVIESALVAFSEEYENVDIYEREDHPTQGWSGQELEFECSDFIATAVLQAIKLSGFTILILIQGQDNEFEKYRETFDAMTSSLMQK